MQTSPSGQGGFTDTGSIDAKTGLEIERLRFAPEAEAEFQSYLVQRSLARARWATAIYLALVAVVTAINMRGSMAPLSGSIVRRAAEIGRFVWPCSMFAPLRGANVR